MQWSEKRVLVTGAGGFVGSHSDGAARRGGGTRPRDGPLQRTWDVGLADQSPVRDDMEVVPSDLADRDSVLRTMNGSEIVFHLGALIAIPYSFDAPSSYVQTNVIGHAETYCKLRAP